MNTLTVRDAKKVPCIIPFTHENRLKSGDTVLFRLSSHSTTAVEGVISCDPGRGNKNRLWVKNAEGEWCIERDCVVSILKYAERKKHNAKEVK